MPRKKEPNIATVLDELCAKHKLQTHLVQTICWTGGLTLHLDLYVVSNDEVVAHGDWHYSRNPGTFKFTKLPRKNGGQHAAYEYIVETLKERYEN